MKALRITHLAVPPRRVRNVPGRLHRHWRRLHCRVSCVVRAIARVRVGVWNDLGLLVRVCAVTAIHRAKDHVRVVIPSLLCGGSDTAHLFLLSQNGFAAIMHADAEQAPKLKWQELRALPVRFAGSTAGCTTANRFAMFSRSFYRHARMCT